MCHIKIFSIMLEKVIKVFKPGKIIIFTIRETINTFY